MAELRRTDRGFVHHYRRATDRAAERVSRATDHGDTTAMRIASSQFEALVRRRAEHVDQGTPARKDGWPE